MAKTDPFISGQSGRYRKRGWSLDVGIRHFFASNAGLTIVILVLIVVFLFKEGAGFFPAYRRDLEIYRTAGLEFVDISRASLTDQEKLSSLLNRAYYAEVNLSCVAQAVRAEEGLAVWNDFTTQTGASVELIAANAGGDPGHLESLARTYEIRKAEALAALPATPHLTASERNELIASLRDRPADATEDPPTLTTLNAELMSARERAAEPLKGMRDGIDAFDSAASDLSGLVSAMSSQVMETKEAIEAADSAAKERKDLLAAAAKSKTPEERSRLVEAAKAAGESQPDLQTPLKALMERKPACFAAHGTLRAFAGTYLQNFPGNLEDPEAGRLLAAARKAWPTFLAGLDRAPALIENWQADRPVPMSNAITSFLTGKDWITGGGWQDFYGILPLATGSLMIAIVALLIAIPCGISAAVYVNQFATPFEQHLVKPIIEFIQAIPSVVLGFIGILVFGTVLRDVSQAEWLSWVPGFPIEERLNIFTAGCLLALMSIPTIFSLAEDAINNVPGAYAEASEALGASKLQTTFRVIVPGAFSGILAAVLLGFGRVIGETMVVLLVAGNRIKIPDFSSGFGAFFQPAHTLTGIIAQELGEVPLGSVHYRALFVVGLLLFAVVLAINATAHSFFSRKPH